MGLNGDSLCSRCDENSRSLKELGLVVVPAITNNRENGYGSILTMVNGFTGGFLPITGTGDLVMNVQIAVDWFNDLNMSSHRVEDSIRETMKHHRLLRP